MLEWQNIGFTTTFKQIEISNASQGPLQKVKSLLFRQSLSPRTATAEEIRHFSTLS
jgi:hypothetical protein